MKEERILKKSFFKNTPRIVAQRAEKELEDPDASFIFYWIAFNSIYADIDAKEAPEKVSLTIFSIKY